MSDQQKIVIGATIKTDGAAAQESVKSYRTQLREAREDLLRLQDQYGEFSKEAVAAAKKVASLNDALGDSSSLVDAFNPDKKFVAFGQAISGVAGGFSALQGAIALTGVESEELNKALLKVQAAMAISQGIDQVLDAMQGFKNLSAVIQSTTAYRKADTLATGLASKAQRLFGIEVVATSTSFKVLKGAIAATGIGLLVVAIGFAVEKLMAFTNRSKEAAEAQKQLKQAMQESESQALQAGLAFNNQLQKLDVARAKARGASDKELFNLEQRNYDERIRMMEKSVGKTADNEALLNSIQEERTNKEVARLQYETTQREKAQQKQREINDRAIADQKRRDEEMANQRKQAQQLNRQLADGNAVDAAGGGMASDLVKLQQDYDKQAQLLKDGGQSLIELDQWYFNAKGAIADKYRQEQEAKDIEANNARMERERSDNENTAALINDNYQKRLAAFDDFANMEGMSAQSKRQFLDTVEKQILADTSLNEAQKTALLAASSKARSNIDKTEYDTKAALVAATGDLLGQLSNIIGQQTKIGKALALAQIATDTALAVSALVKNSESNPTNAVTFGGAGALQFATGLVRILANIAKAKQILSSGNGTGGGLSTPNLKTGAIPTQAPLQPTLATAQTRLDNQSINDLGNRAIKAFVLEKDVTGAQERIREINRRSRL
ncbi:hypothetical protein SAMN05444008_11281 [Cnuella takakiae]|uniref:Uncharacterized protein n=1 Tax=Cnuella takakiae TaxID=1302690 RepID=A0A1M5EKU3_9BACT|nr:hypothetical protein [Cnuella takakiae]OLY91207.1 hypothetical protein BUE76_04305 [Cnuella takakiae]SHF79652.1 hypothetical protein SAMN05444008_11281 [Cnuella takakiae]